MKKRHITFITGTRAEYGLMKNTLLKLRSDTFFNLSLIVTGAHLMHDRGFTIDEIRKDGFDVKGEVDLELKGDSEFDAALAFGNACIGIAKSLHETKPDIVLIVGDRTETLAAACISAHMDIPIAHIAGGDVSGSLDNSMRHAITKLSHIHFPSNKHSADIIKKLGEKPSTIFIVGAPNLDSIRQRDYTKSEDVFKKFKLEKDKPIALLVQHSVTTDLEDVDKQIRATIEAINELKLQTIAVYPNIDAGNFTIIRELENARNKFIKVFKNIERKDFLGLMNIASLMIGNSSSAIIEAPSFGLPAVNISTRQSDRVRGKNIIDVPYDKEKIKSAIKKAIYDKKFISIVKKSTNPYGDWHSAEKIVNVLKKIKLDKKLLQKEIWYKN